MKNPFVFGKIVDEKNFCNRKTEINELRRNIINGYSVWLFAPRRYGKSSLIHQVFKKNIPNVKTIYFDLYNVKSVDDFVRKYSNILAKELFNWKDDVKKLSKQLGRYLKSLQPQISFDAAASPSITLTSNDILEQSKIEEVLNLPETIANEQKKKICIAFDEFQEISRIDKFIVNWMRSAFQNHKNVSYIFLGSKQSLMQEIFTSINSPFYEYALKMNIGEIKRDDLYSFILEKFNEQGINILPNTINDILDNSKCHPHFTQYFASVVFDELNGGGDENLEDFKNIWVSKIINSQSIVFQNIYDQLNNNQRNVLIALANSSKEIFSNKRRKEFGLPGSSTLATNLMGLIAKDLIYKEGDAYFISNPVLELWLNTLN